MYDKLVRKCIDKDNRTSDKWLNAHTAVNVLINLRLS